MDRVVLFGIPEEGRGAGKREWYSHMAKDHFAYIGAYRKCIDEIEQLKKEMWNIIIDTKTEMNNRIQATQELHSLSKTSVLLRDLPFVTNLSKFYDKEILNSNYDNYNPLHLKGTNSNKNDRLIDKDSIERKNTNKPENLDSPFDFINSNVGKTFSDNSELKYEKSPKYIQDSR